MPQTERDHQCGDYTALPGGGRTPPPVVPIHSPHEPASGGNENSPGGALPRGPACMHSGMLPSRSAPIPAQQNVALACLFAIPAVGWPPRRPSWVGALLPLCSPPPLPRARRAGPAGGERGRLRAPLLLPVRRAGVAPRCAALVVRCLYHLAHGRLTRIQRLFGAETCSTPVLNRTQRGLFQLFTRWSTRYCNQDLRRRPRRRGATPAGAAGLRVLLHCQCSARPWGGALLRGPFPPRWRWTVGRIQPH